MEARVAMLEKKMEDMNKLKDRIGIVETKMRQLDELKEDFADKLKAKLTTMEVDAEMKQGQVLNDLRKVVEEAQAKFQDIDNNMMGIYNSAKEKFQEVEAAMLREAGKSDRHDKKSGFLPDKMMVPKTFSDNINNWRKWRNEVAKYFDEGNEGMKVVMDDVARQEVEITREVLEEACRRSPTAIGEKLQRWKHLYRALEKLTERGSGQGHQHSEGRERVRGMEAVALEV